MSNILIIDDDVNISYQIMGILKDMDVECVPLMEPLHLKENLDYEIPDLILLDVMMPGISGVEILRDLKKHADHKNIPVIMITGDTEKSLLQVCFEIGATDFLHKPIDPHELKARIHSILQIQSYQRCLVKEIKDRKQAEAQLVQAAKLASIGQFAAGIAHELNTPLAIIKLSAFELQEDLEDQEFDEFPEVLKRIDRQVDRASKVTEHLINFSGDQNPEQFDEVSPNELTENFMRLIKETMKNIGIQWDVYIEEKLPDISASMLLIEQVLFSLANNAKSAMENIEDGKITLTVYRKDEFVFWEMKDSGTGIKEEIIPLIFDPFFTTREIGDGFGLGLSSCYGIVDDHKGHLRLVETSESGSVFQMSIPISNH